jgi:hypothetical protein
MRRIAAIKAADAPKRNVAWGFKYCQRNPAPTPETMADTPTAP